MNFSKLTKLLSVVQFLRPLGAFKQDLQNRTCYLAVVVGDKEIILISKVFKSFIVSCYVSVMSNNSEWSIITLQN